MTMSPEERRRRMHRALERNSGQRSAETRRSSEAGITDDLSADNSAEDINKAERAHRPNGRKTVSGMTNGSSNNRRRNSRPDRKGSGNGHGNGGSGSSGTLGAGNKLLFIAAAAVVFILVLVLAIKAMIGAVHSRQQAAESVSIEESSIAESESESESAAEAKAVDDFKRAELMYEQYDYDNAIELLKSLPDYDANEEAKALVTKCEETKSTLEEQDIYKITHVFFHILCVDPENAFDESKWGTQAGGYNSLMTTISEFEKMIQEMYDKGYVLVSVRDLAHEEAQSDGTVKMVKGSIMLPPGKKAFVMSEDDVCYYEYMEGAGFADKMIVGEDGRPTLHYTDKDGNEFTGDYDLVPILDKFIDEHPDFSYKGHKACLVFTGYNGILGYRTDESYDPNSEYYDPKLEQGHDVEAERKEAVEVLKALHEDGYDLGSHSWGHRDLGAIEMDRFKKDCDRWNRNVAPLIKEATGEQPDIIIFPKGADIGDWHGYSSDNERFKYMYSLGFRYFCNVDNNQYWVQLGDTYLRQGRRALDGLNMWLQISGQNSRLSDLFDDVSSIFDPARPTPVPAY